MATKTKPYSAMTNFANQNLAAIYIRTSSEQQAEKASPDEQESGCRKTAIEHGLKVVGVYKDIERYRVKTCLVDPSGTRDDRPGMLAMLQDASAGKFKTLIAWKEDRLYRGMKAMILVIDAMETYHFNILLALETFDPRIAPLKAWVAGMELQNMRDRMDMGVKARLRNGKANTGQDRYGYKRVGEDIVIVPEEARWVKEIFHWYTEQIPIQEIQSRLINADAPQKGSSHLRENKWERTTIQGILKAAESYYIGKKIQTRKGEAFEISVTPLIDEETYQKFLQIRHLHKTYPSHNLKREYLLGGMLYCACNHKWAARVASYSKKNKNGERKERKSLYWTYHCPQRRRDISNPECPRTIGSLKADSYVWDKVIDVIQNPEIILSRARTLAQSNQQRTEDVNNQIKYLSSQLEALQNERQQVITLARKGLINDADLEAQLGQVEIQVNEKRAEITQNNNLIQFTLPKDWDSRMYVYFEGLRASLGIINAAPNSDEERRLIFDQKRKIVLDLVDRVLITKDRQLKIVFHLRAKESMQSADFCQIQLVGTYTHTPASPSLPEWAFPWFANSDDACSASDRSAYSALANRHLR